MTAFDDHSILRLLADCIAARSSIENIRTVLGHGADPNGRVHKGLTPLHYAAFENAHNVIKVLIDHGAKVNVADNIGYTPLHIAAKNGHYEAAKTLIDNNAIVDFMNKNSEAPDVCQALAELTMNPLNLALENNHPEVTELLLQNGANANQKYFLGHEINLIPLEHIRCMEVLLMYGANPNAYSRAGITALMKACKEGNEAAIKMLIQYGADIDLVCGPQIDQKRAIHYAILSGNIDIVKTLLEAGANLRKPPSFKYPPLEYAITQDKLKIAKLLLEYGANPNETNEDGCSPLQVACSVPDMAFQRETIALLLEYGADANFGSSTYSYGAPCLTPLMEYLSYFADYDIDIIKLLLKHGAEVNFVPATKYFKIKDAAGVLQMIGKMERHPEVFQNLLDAAGTFSVDAITSDKSGLSAAQREVLLEEAEVPRSLMHQARHRIRRLVRPPPIPPKIEKLPVPSFLKNYLLFDV